MLERTSSESLSPEVLAILAHDCGNDAAAVPAILSHLLARDLSELVVAVVERLGLPPRVWPDSLVTVTADYLIERQYKGAALRLLALFAGSPAVAQKFSRAMRDIPPHDVEVWLSDEQAREPAVFWAICLAVAEYKLATDDFAGVVALLRKPQGVNPFELARPLKLRISTAIEQLLSQSSRRPELTGQLAGLVASMVSDTAKEFFAGPGFAQLCSQLVGAARLANAPSGSRQGLLREKYLYHHLERREGIRFDSLGSEFAVCAALLRYFAAVANLRPVEQLPFPQELHAQLAQPRFSFEDGCAADVLMSYLVFRNRPDVDISSPGLFEALAFWYAETAMEDNRIPSAFVAADVLSFLNSTHRSHPQWGVTLTRFAEHMRSAKGDQGTWSPDIGLDCVLVSLELLATALRDRPYYRVFFSAMLPHDEEARPTFIDLCISVLAKEQSVPPVPFSSLLSGGRSPLGKPTKSCTGSDVLLIGHLGQGTGLNRNSRMLQDALKGSGRRVSTLAYELPADEFAQGLTAWSERCGPHPTVVAAVNAQDIPSLFIRDRHGILDSCNVIGFFLWETSAAPRVQELGVALVDEIWTPTNYVAGIYAPFGKPVHVVGKGLFARRDWPARPPASNNGPVRFLTVFDFHSSVERKNPLASVLAFRKAFPGAEKVEMIVKASNVDPQHPGNAQGQWEELSRASAGDRRIHVVTERYSEAQMQQLMRRTSCVVSLHRAEGFGYVLSDALALGLPVIATDYSGNTDFCDSENSYPVAYRLIPVRAQGAYWEDEEAIWADPDVDSAAAQMRQVYSDYPQALRKAARGRERLIEVYSKEAFAERLGKRLASRRPQPVLDPSAAAVQ
ncbi:MAG: glycosyltransferase family 4 protein [Alphaproteobacteria bacterium]|nr:glycosyltransferase family 4 protein [Alphaproteobacteria bacterium]